MIDHTGDYATDPGTEVLDLPDELALNAHEARSWLDVPAHVITPDLARLTGHAPDYEWCTWLADVLRAAGLHVIEQPGWKTRGRPRSAGPFTPRGLLWHHDGSKIGPTPSMARFIAQEGRPADGIPAPLSQTWVCVGCDGAHPVGTWHVLAAGRANHGGVGDGWGKITRDLANSLALGVETDHTVDEPWPADLYEAMVTGSAAILAKLRSDPHEWMAGHKEYAVGRKIDPDHIDMDKARRDVDGITLGGHELVEFPGVKHFQVGHKCGHHYVLRLEQWLHAIYPSDHNEPDDTFTLRTKTLVQHFQETHPRLAGDADGIPGPLTWRMLQLAARGAGA